MSYRCGGTVGAIFTCPLEVIKTRLQSSKLAFRAVYYPQVQLGTISGEGMVRPTSVSPGLFSVLKWVLLLLPFSVAWHQWCEFQFFFANMECKFCPRLTLDGFLSVWLLPSAVEREIIILKTHTYSGFQSVPLNFTGVCCQHLETSQSELIWISAWRCYFWMVSSHLGSLVAMTS